MIDAIHFAGVLAGGILLGLFFFGGLWWSTCRGIAAGIPALWFLTSRILRTSIVLAGFYYLASGNWHRAVACLLGFVIARLAVLAFADASLRRSRLVKELHHES